MSNYKSNYNNWQPIEMLAFNGRLQEDHIGEVMCRIVPGGLDEALSLDPNNPDHRRLQDLIAIQSAIQISDKIPSEKLHACELMTTYRDKYSGALVTRSYASLFLLSNRVSKQQAVR